MHITLDESDIIHMLKSHCLKTLNLDPDKYWKYACITFENIEGECGPEIQAEFDLTELQAGSPCLEAK